MKFLSKIVLLLCLASIGRSYRDNDDTVLQHDQDGASRIQNLPDSNNLDDGHYEDKATTSDASDHRQSWQSIDDSDVEQLNEDKNGKNGHQTPDQEIKKPNNIDLNEAKQDDTLAISSQIIKNGQTSEVSNSNMMDAESTQEKKEEDTTMPSFEEWKKKQLEDSIKRGHHSSVSTGNSLSRKNRTPSQNNYASSSCGAKIVDSNPEAKNPEGILLGDKDVYMNNPCSASIWFVIELCDHLKVESIEIANLELFSSRPENFRISISQRNPTRDWKVIDTFKAKDERKIQAFSMDVDDYAKYIKVEILSVFRDEHYCPLTFFRVLGTTWVDDFDDSENADNTDIEGQDATTRGNRSQLTDNITDTTSNVKETNKGNESTIMGLGLDAVITIVKKVGEAFTTRSERNQTTFVGNIEDGTSNLKGYFPNYDICYVKNATLSLYWYLVIKYNRLVVNPTLSESGKYKDKIDEHMLPSVGKVKDDITVNERTSHLKKANDTRVSSGTSDLIPITTYCSFLDLPFHSIFGSTIEEIAVVFNLHHYLCCCIIVSDTSRNVSTIKKLQKTSNPSLPNKRIPDIPSMDLSHLVRLTHSLNSLDQSLVVELKSEVATPSLETSRSIDFGIHASSMSLQEHQLDVNARSSQTLIEEHSNFDLSSGSEISSTLNELITATGAYDKSDDEHTMLSSILQPSVAVDSSEYNTEAISRPNSNESVSDSKNETDPSSNLTSSSSSVQSTLEKLLSVDFDYDVDIDFSTPESATVHKTASQRESVLTRLNNRIRALEKNYKLTTLYLEDFSKKFVKRLDDAQKASDKRINVLTSIVDQNAKLVNSLVDRLHHLENNLEGITNEIRSISERNHHNGFGETSVCLLIEMLCVLIVICFVFSSKQNKKNDGRR